MIKSRNISADHRHEGVKRNICEGVNVSTDRVDSGVWLWADLTKKEEESVSGKRRRRRRRGAEEAISHSNWATEKKSRSCQKDKHLSESSRFRFFFWVKMKIKMRIFNKVTFTLLVLMFSFELKRCLIFGPSGLYLSSICPPCLLLLLLLLLMSCALLQLLFNLHN